MLESQDISGSDSYNCVLKIYPSGARAYVVSIDRNFGSRKGNRIRDSSPSEPSDGAIRRARQKVKDLCLSNEFRYFVTLTLDQSKIDRYDVAAVTRKLNQWLDNHVRRNGLKYVLVAEHHKDGAIHFHGFFNDALPVRDSGIKQKGRKVYNLPAWTLGYTTAIRLYGTYEKAVSYVLKYLSKEGAKVGGRWYYSGGALRLPEVYHLCVDPHDYLERSDAFQFDTDFGRMVYLYESCRQDCD